MREFEYTFQDGLKVGLRRDKKNPRNNEALTQAYNVRCGPYGVEPYVALVSYDDYLESIAGSTQYVESGYVEDGFVE